MHNSSLYLALLMYLNIFNHFLINEYLGCFQSFAVTNSATVNNQSCNFYCASLYCTSQILHFLQIEGLRQPCAEQVFRHHFSNGICLLLVSVSHFGNSRNISNFFIISVFVIVICDQ